MIDIIKIYSNIVQNLVDGMLKFSIAPWQSNSSDYKVE